MTAPPTLGLGLTTDGGKSFHMVFKGESPAGGAGFVILWAGFTGGRVPYLLAVPSDPSIGAHAANQLRYSHDGARSWDRGAFLQLRGPRRLVTHART